MTKKRVFSLLLALALAVQLIPVPSFAAQCSHHTHDGDCGYAAASEGAPCTHGHDDGCYQAEEACIHSHDEACGYAEANGEAPGAPCGHTCDAGCQTEVLNCVHSHDEDCGYAAPVVGSPCAFDCGECKTDAQKTVPEVTEEQKEETSDCTREADCQASTHQEDCAKDLADKAAAQSAARVKAVQDLIDALPDTVTEDTRGAVESQLTAIDNAKAGLSDEELARLDIGPWQTVMIALDALNGQPGASVPKAMADPTVGPAYISNNNGVVTIWGETANADPVSDLHIDLYSGDTKMASVKLNDVDGIYAASTSALTWHLMVIGEEYDDYWTTTWEKGYPKAGAKPDKVVMYIDGTKADEDEIKEASPDDLVLVAWDELFAAELNGTIYGSIQAAINAAGTAKSTVNVLTNITVNPQYDIQIAKDQDITLDLGGYTVHGAFMVYGTALIQNGTIINTNENVSAIENNGKDSDLTVKDLTVTSARHGIRVDGGKAQIISGTYTTNGTGTVHAVNISSDAQVVISGGEFNGASPTSGGSAVATRGDKTTLAISGGTFKNPNGPHTLALWGGTIEITGGTFHKAAEDTLNLGGTDTPNGESGNITGISGGIFEEMPDVELLAEGKAAAQRADGWYEITKAYAQIVNKGNYATLQEAVTAAAAGQTVKLLEDVTADVNVSTAITLDLDDKALKGTITLAQQNVPLTIQGTGAGSSIQLTTPAKAGWETGVYTGDTKVETAEVSAQGTEYQAKWSLKAPTVTVSADKTSIEKEKGTATLTAAAVHELPVTYQWFQDGTAIDGAEESTYEVTGLTEAAEFTCKVTVTDGGQEKTAESEAVTITVAAREAVIAIEEEALNAVIGDQETVTFTYTKTEGMPAVSVKSSDETVATVADRNGTVTVTILKAGTAEITVSFAGNDDFTAASDTITLTVSKANAKVTVSDVTAVYGDTLTLTARVERSPSTRAAGKDKVAFFYQGTKLGEALVIYNDAKTSGTATLTYDTTLGKLPVGAGKIDVEYGGGDNLGTSDAELTVTLEARELTVSGLSAENRVYNGTTAVTLSGGTVSGILEGDREKVTVTIPSSGTVTSAHVGDDKAVTYEVNVSGDKAGFYTLDTLPTVTVDIVPARLEAVYVSETIANNQKPQLEVKVTGFVAGETAATAHGYVAPKVTQPDTDVGTYTLSPSGGSATNYIFSYEKGTLTIGYAIVKGGEQVVKKGSTATFVSNAHIDKFVKVLMDGRRLDDSAYILEEGSTKVTLKAAYIRSLKAGEHTLTIVSTDGEAATTFTVKNVPWSYDSPKTGDTTNTGLWILLALAGLVGLLTSILGKKYLTKGK